jgi:polyisoprenoid-binding protein YceI
MHRKALLSLAALAVASSIFAFQAKPFSLKDPKGVNAVTFVCDSPVEPIVGSADGIDGSVSFDPADLKASRGTITVAAKSVKVTSAGMTDHLMGAEWLGPKEFEQISFEVKSIEEAKKVDEMTYQLKAKGTFTMKGVTEDKTVDVVVRYLPGRLAERNRAEGDLLTFRTSFSFDRMKFGMGPDFPGIGKDVEVTVVLAAARPTGAAEFKAL